MRKINREPKSRPINIDKTSSNGSNIDLDSISEIQMTSSVKRMNQKRFKEKTLQELVKKLDLMVHHFQKLIV